MAAHPSVAPHLDARAGAQRARLLEGMTQAVAEKGYAYATVADAVRFARVSRGTFYAQFASKEECFLEAYRHGVEVLEARIDAGVRAAAGGWRAELRAGLRGYLDCLAAGVDQLVCARLRAGDLDDLDALTDTLLTCAVAQLAGAATDEGATGWT